jgi:hypothetical protein
MEEPEVRPDVRKPPIRSADIPLQGRNARDQQIAAATMERWKRKRLV